jgi:peptidoglycan/LPS O-acetylase OafA/YrhL
MFFAIVLAVVSSLRLHPQGMTDFQWFGLVRCMCEFSMGIGVYHLLKVSPSSSSNLILGLILLIAGLAIFIYQPSTEYFVLPSSFAGLVFALAGDYGAIASLLRAKPLQLLGQISYSTYICHYLIKFLIKFALLRPGIQPDYVFPSYILAVLCASSLLHVYIERPAQIALRREIRLRFRGAAK